MVSAIARHRREGVLATVACARLHRKIMADVEAGHYVQTDLLPAPHREAEHLVLAVDNIALRAADALHLAQASLAGAAAIVKYDRMLSEAAARIGLNALP